MYKQGCQRIPNEPYCGKKPNEKCPFIDYNQILIYQFVYLLSIFPNNFVCANIYRSAIIFLNLDSAVQTLQSPDKQSQLRFELKDNIAYYNLHYKNTPVVKQSKPGLTLVKYHFIIGSIRKQVIKNKLGTNIYFYFSYLISIHCI
jgi:hypothetical protein